MTKPPNPSPSREILTRLMHSHGHDGVLRMRTSGGSDATLNRPQIPRPEGQPMATPVPLRESERLAVQITGTKTVTAECVTPVDGKPCGAKSGKWMSIVPPQDWARGHSVKTGHTKFVRHEDSDFQVVRPIEEMV
ncbi:hypothetical protein ACH4OW_23815 [Streptomyces sp. NPDC017056]|uniref:DUF7848 domain-containing protein n=1 Tax=Streptomyces sp. NPDC017056 TaxID=3364973 RepID=UPI0037A42738